MAVLRMPEWVRNHPNEQFRRHYRELLRSVVGEGENAATLKNLFEANSILKADTAKQPEAVVAGTNVLLGRESGEIDWLTSTQVKSLLGLPLLTVKEDAAISESVTISNSDFETGDLTGWTATNGPTAGTTDPILGVHSLPASWGTTYCFFGNPVTQGTIAVLERTIDLSSLSADLLNRIDNEEAVIVLQWDQASIDSGVTDEYDVRMQFQNSSGTTLDTVERDTQTVPGTLDTAETLSGTAPENTRKVALRWRCHQHDPGPGADYCIDNIELLITADAQSVSSVDTIEVDSGKLIDDGNGQVSLDLSGDGSLDFIGLSDTPSSLAAGNIHRVNAAGTALEAVAPDTSGNVLTSDGSQWISQAPGAGSGSGLALEDSSTATGAAEFLQVTVTSTPSTANRLEFHFRSILPEIDSEALNFTFILDDDSELTSAVYDYAYYFRPESGSLSSAAATNDTKILIGNNTGNASDEGYNVIFRQISLNGSESAKVFAIEATNLAENGLLVAIHGHVRVNTTSSIKGMRVDTDNTGDMLEAGEAQAWIQT